jgi:hypothetical protein
VKFRPLPIVAGLLLLAAALLAFREFRWRAAYPLAAANAETPSPDGAYVAEIRELAPSLGLGSGVFLRGRGDVLRSLRPRLVMVGSCEELSTRWFGQRRLVVTCVVRSGEPAVLQEVVKGVKIELVVDRHFG